jgi:phosphate-selective porin OprO/OprP
MNTRLAHISLAVPLACLLAGSAHAQDVTVRVRGYMQADNRFYLADGATPAPNTWEIRRARPILEATAYKYFDFRVMPDFGEGKAQLMEAYADLRFRRQLVLRSGKFKPPLGLERLQSATDLKFAERGAPTNLVPNRDVGIELYGDLAAGTMSYAIGAFDGTPDLGNGDGDRSNAKDVAGRLFFQPFLRRGPALLRVLGLGIAASSGNETGSTASSGLASYRTPGQQVFFAYRSDGTAAGTVVAEGRRQRVVPQGFLYSGPFGLLWEYAASRQHVRLGSSEAVLTHRAWQVAGSVAVTGEPASYRGVTPRHPFDPDSATWGALELALRYGEVRLDSAAFPTYANPATSAAAARSWGVSVNWYLARGVRLSATYERTGFDAAAGTPRTPERFLVTRLQMGF